MDDNERLAGSSSLEDLFATLGDSRLEALNEVKELQIVSQVLLQHEAARMDRKFGEDHPRIRSIKAFLEQNPDNINALEVGVQIATVSIPKVYENQTLLHGRVVDEKLRGIADLFVSITDEGGKTLRSLGSSRTEPSGYYAFVIDPGDLEKLSNVAEEGVFLAVRTRKGELVHREFEPLDIAEGDHKFVEVVLDLEDLFGGERQPEQETGYEQRQERGAYEKGSEPSDEAELEKVSGIGRKRADQLRKAGIPDLQALSEADEATLRDILGNIDIRKLKRQSAEILEKMKGEARK